MDALESSIRKIWTFADAYRNSNGMRLSAVELLLEAYKHGIPVDMKITNEFLLHSTDGSQFTIPQCMADFLIQYLAGRCVDSFLDPFARFGQLTASLLIDSKKTHIVEMTGNQAEYELASILDGDNSAAWHLSEQFPLNLLTRLDENFDLIISCPPLGMNLDTSLVVVHDGHEISVKDSRAELLILLSCLHLAPEGEAIFMVSNQFFQRKPNGVLNALNSLGYHVHSVVALPDGVIRPLTSIDVCLAFIKKEPSEQIFTGKITHIADTVPLLKNLLNRRAGLTCEFGRLVDPDSFISWHHVMLKDELMKLANRTGVTEIRLESITDSISLMRSSTSGENQDTANCVYLPLIGNSPATTNISDLKIKPQNCARIVFKQEHALAQYVANFYNTQLGHIIRESLMRGMCIQKMNLYSLQNSIVYLPEMNFQQDVIDNLNRIRELQSYLQDLTAILAEKPKNVYQVHRQLKIFASQDTFEPWIETLPFPLASILWRYHAGNDNSNKVESLLCFFEATALFVFTVLISAFRSDIQLFNEKKREWFVDSRHPENVHQLLKVGTFGTWVIFAERFAKTARTMLSNQDERNRCTALFGKHDINILERTILSKPLFEILNNAKDYRNQWKGHGGIAGEKEHKKRLSVLEGLLTSFRSNTSGCFDEWRLIRPQNMELIDGVYHSTVQSLLGTRTPFRIEHVDLIIPMESKNTYMLYSHATEPLKLIPFFRMMSEPESEQNACYFFSRIDKDSINWISYNNETSPERSVADRELTSIIEDIRKCD